MARTAFLLLPEAVPADQEPRPHAPVYAEVVGRPRAGLVTVRTLAVAEDEDGVSLRVPVAATRHQQVQAAEASRTGPGLLLRRPVVADGTDHPIYGQVVDCTGDAVSIRHAKGETTVPASAVTEVAPVIVFLLYRAQLAAAAIDDSHAAILDRLLGTATTAASRSIPRLMSGILPPSQQPRRQDQLLWLQPASGIDTLVSVGHVVDFGFYKDGGRPSPANVILGASFYEDPTTSGEASSASDPPSGVLDAVSVGPSPGDGTLRVSARVANQTATRSRPLSAGDERFADLLDAFDEDSDAGEVTTHRTPLATHRKRNRATDVPRADQLDDVASARILAAVSDDPELVRFYMRKMQRLHAFEDRHHLPSVSDFVGPSDSTSSKDNFRPPAPVHALHEKITAPRHKGKQPMAFVQDARLSNATKFTPRPVFMIYLYDFQFGDYGLSILHFVRVHENKRSSITRSVGMRNFSTALTLPEVPENQSLTDLIDALRVLAQYAAEFFDSVTREFINRASDFALDLKDFEPLSYDDVAELTKWFDRLFGDYRAAVEADVRDHSDTRSRVHERFRMNDAALTMTLLKASRRAARPVDKPWQSRSSQDGRASSRYGPQSHDPASAKNRHSATHHPAGSETERQGAVPSIHIWQWLPIDDPRPVYTIVLSPFRSIGTVGCVCTGVPDCVARWRPDQQSPTMTRATGVWCVADRRP